MMTTLIFKGTLFSALLIIAAIWDLKKRIIPNSVVLFILIIGFIQIRPINALLGLLVTATPFLLVAVIFKKRDALPIGGGDIKLMGACGFVLGIGGGIFQSVVSLALAVFTGIILAIIRRKSLYQTQIPLAPFFCAGGICSYVVLLTALQ